MADIPDRLLHQKHIRYLAGGISDMTLWRWRRKGLIPEPRVIAGRNYWLQSQIDAWLSQGVPQPTDGQAA